MGVVLVNDALNANVEKVIEKAKNAAGMVKVNP
jgi:hypothetical protein